jgi:hypothetical protein
MSNNTGHATSKSFVFVLLVLLGAACDHTPTPTSPSIVGPCTVSATLQPSASIPSAGGTGVVTVATSHSQCNWTASSEVPWIGFTSSSGLGNADVRFNVAANPNDNARQGDIILNDTRFRITQIGASCDVQLSPANQSAPSAGMTGSVAVTTGSSCAWSATSNVGWLTVMSDPTTTGEGTVQFTAAANPATTARTGLIAIGNQLFTVTQAAK